MITKKQFDKVQRLMAAALNELQLFHTASVKQYGIDYGEENLDEIIDSIDYGQGGMTFEYFTQLMNEAKAKQS